MMIEFSNDGVHKGMYFLPTKGNYRSLFAVEWAYETKTLNISLFYLWVKLG
jgi:hypothetical protein